MESILNTFYTHFIYLATNYILLCIIYLVKILEETTEEVSFKSTVNTFNLHIDFIFLMLLICKTFKIILTLKTL